MKKNLVMVLSALCLLGLSGCDKNSQGTTPENGNYSIVGSWEVTEYHDSYSEDGVKLEVHDWKPGDHFACINNDKGRSANCLNAVIEFKSDGSLSWVSQFTDKYDNDTGTWSTVSDKFVVIESFPDYYGRWTSPIPNNTFEISELKKDRLVLTRHFSVEDCDFDYKFVMKRR